MEMPMREIYYQVPRVGFAITARTLMSTLGNLDFALAGHGELEYATKQLELANDFINQIDLIIGKDRGRN
jgi:hypothetical protein